MSLTWGGMGETWTADDEARLQAIMAGIEMDRRPGMFESWWTMFGVTAVGVALLTGAGVVGIQLWRWLR